MPSTESSIHRRHQDDIQAWQLTRCCKIYMLYADATEESMHVMCTSSNHCLRISFSLSLFCFWRFSSPSCLALLVLSSSSADFPRSKWCPKSSSWSCPALFSCCSTTKPIMSKSRGAPSLQVQMCNHIDSRTAQCTVHHQDEIPDGKQLV